MHHQRSVSQCLKSLEQYHCPLCDYLTNSRANLERHAASHNEANERALQCGKCTVRFITNVKLRRHIDAVHGAGIQCTFEAKKCTFSTKHSLYRTAQKYSTAEATLYGVTCNCTQERHHMSAKYEASNCKQKSTSLQQCDKLFHRHSNLKLHTRTHVDLK